jgi:hypothetical protein
LYPCASCWWPEVCKGLGLGKPRDAIFVDGEVESKRTLDRDAAVAEVFVSAEIIHIFSLILAKSRRLDEVVRQCQLTLLDHFFAECTQLSLGKFGRQGLSVFPTIYGCVADIQSPRQVLLAQGELLPDFLYQGR